MEVMVPPDESWVLEMPQVNSAPYVTGESSLTGPERGIGESLYSRYMEVRCFADVIWYRSTTSSKKVNDVFSEFISDSRLSSFVTEGVSRFYAFS